MIRGIGLVHAKKMVKAFGGKVFDVIRGEPGRLREMTGEPPSAAFRWAQSRLSPR
jgi:exodeoxyribonuclease V alpha subunit